MPLNEEAINQVYNNAYHAANGDEAAAAQILKDAIMKLAKKKVLIHEPDLNAPGDFLEELYGDDEAPQPIYEEDDGEDEVFDGPMEDEDAGDEEEAPPPAIQNMIDNLHVEANAGNLHVEAPPQAANNIVWHQAADNIGAAPAPMVGEPVWAAPAAQPAAVVVGNHYQHGGAHAVVGQPIQVPKPINDNFPIKQKAAYIGGNHGHDMVGYSGEKADNTTKGLMVFYVNTQGLGSGAALDLLDKVKTQYKKTEANLVASKIEVMWLPTGTGDTGAEFFSFR